MEVKYQVVDGEDGDVLFVGYECDCINWIEANQSEDYEYLNIRLAPDQRGAGASTNGIITGQLALF